MADDEHKSLKQIDHELADKAEALEKDIEQAEARHGLSTDDEADAADEDVKPPA